MYKRQGQPGYAGESGVFFLCIEDERSGLSALYVVRVVGLWAAGLCGGQCLDGVSHGISPDCVFAGIWSGRDAFGWSALLSPVSVICTCLSGIVPQEPAEFPSILEEPAPVIAGAERIRDLLCLGSSDLSRGHGDRELSQSSLSGDGDPVGTLFSGSVELRFLQYP